MRVHLDYEEIGRIAQHLKGTFAKGDFYTRYENKNAGDQLLVHLENARKIARDEASLQRYAFDADVNSIESDIIRINAELARAADTIAKVADSCRSNEEELLRLLANEPEQPRQRVTSPKGPEQLRIGPLTLEGFTLGGIIGDVIMGRTVEIDGQSFVQIGESKHYNSGGSYQRFDITFIKFDGAVCVGSKDNEKCVEIGGRVGEIVVETGTPQDDEYASRHQQTGKDGKYNDHGGYVGINFSVNAVSAHVGASSQTSEGKTTFSWDPGLGVGHGLAAYSHEVRDERGYTGTEYSGISLPFGIGVSHQEKKHAIDYW